MRVRIFTTPLIPSAFAPELGVACLDDLRELVGLQPQLPGDLTDARNALARRPVTQADGEVPELGKHVRVGWQARRVALEGICDLGSRDRSNGRRLDERVQVGDQGAHRLHLELAALVRSRHVPSTIASPPRLGRSVTPRNRAFSLFVRDARSCTRASTVAITTFISSVAKAAPRQRRTPPPNGTHVYGSGAPSRKRSGRKACGSGGESTGAYWRSRSENASRAPGSQ